MALILSLETATTVCSVALHKDGELVALQELHLQKSHSGYLAVLIKDIVNYSGHELKDVEMIALSKGPGSYTGLRIGTATAKGLCYALDIPLLAVNTLEAMAYGVSKYYYDRDVLLCPMIDARRMEVYCLFTDSKLDDVRETEAVVVDELSFKSQLETNEVIFFGNGAFKCQDVLKQYANARFIADVHPSALSVGINASEKVKSGDLEFEDLAYFEPYYLKDFQSKNFNSKAKNLI